MPPARRSSRAPAPAGVPWHEAAPAPVVLVTGTEALLAERAVNRVVRLAREADPGLEVTRIGAADYTPGRLLVATSPSLFAEGRVVVLDGLEAGTDQALAEAQAYLADPQDDTILVLRHGGGARGKRLLDAVRAAGIVVVVCEPVRSDADKVAFASAELQSAGRRADARAVRALVDAVGSDLRELAAACAQLVADTTGLITAETVRRYYGGRVEATGFQVADAALAGDAGRALALLRHASATGLDPVPLVAALAAKVRTLAQVAAARGRGAAAVRELGLAPWLVDRALSELRHWTPESLAEAVLTVARADAEVKGESRDRDYAVERAVLRLARAARAGRA